MIDWYVILTATGYFCFGYAFHSLLNLYLELREHSKLVKKARRKNAE